MKTEISYNDNKKVEIHLDKMTIVDEFYTTFNETDIENGKRYTLYIHPKQTIKLNKIECVLPLEINKQSDNLFCNGFQSRNESRLFDFDEKINSLSLFAIESKAYSSDYHFKKFVQRSVGVLHSWSYTYLRKYNENAIRFWGSLNENNGFTLFTANSKKNELSIKKDIENLRLEHSFCALDFIVLNGDEKQVFETYRDELELKPQIEKVLTGWTSRLNYYNKITEDVILQNLNNFVEKEIPIDFFQIDDGWQTHVGDWLSVKDSFPNGMETISNKIHKQNIKSGLWLAPFIAETSSTLFKSHPDWFLKNDNGRPLSVGYNSMWKGKFYALDIYNDKVREYLTGIFYNVFNRWKFDLVKLDFLYAVCILPRPNKTRGQVMHDALTFLRELCTDKIILSSGVPLVSGFSIFDYCQTNNVKNLSMGFNFWDFLSKNERENILVTLRTIIGRWQLNNIGFQNASELFITSEKNKKLTPNQVRTFQIVNTLLSNLQFISGDMSELNEDIIALKDRIVHSVTPLRKDVYKIWYTLLDKKYDCFVNLTNTKQSIEEVNLNPFESQIRFSGKINH